MRKTTDRADRLCGLRGKPCAPCDGWLTLVLHGWGSRVERGKPFGQQLRLLRGRRHSSVLIRKDGQDDLPTEFCMGCLRDLKISSSCIDLCLYAGGNAWARRASVLLSKELENASGLDCTKGLTIT